MLQPWSGGKGQEEQGLVCGESARELREGGSYFTWVFKEVTFKQTYGMKASQASSLGEEYSVQRKDHGQKL